MGKHTPGPWWTEGKNIVAAVHNQHAAPIGEARQMGEVSGTTREPLPAMDNARLMAAAPELLALLEEAHKLQMAAEPWGLRMIERTRAAIAKANNGG